LEKEYPSWDAPAKAFDNAYKRTPYTILNSTLLSFRTKDSVTLEAGKRLFSKATTPEEMIKIPLEELAQIIYPVGFYNKKAKGILDVAHFLLEHCNAVVPDSLDKLVKIKGIGPKTAKIVLESAFGENVIAVDTHVHRILNVINFVNTTTPEETDSLLKEKLKEIDVKGLNQLLVSFGQVICKPQKPLCQECVIREYCSK
jgi:endonuclease-3